jgi:diacylglycerol kinase family enzyme
VKVTLIHNPDAGKSRRITADHLLRAIGNAGYIAKYQSVKEPDWHRALDEPADILAVAGGDGLVGRVAKRCVGRATPIAVLPLGTANNIARCLGLTDIPLVRLVEQWRTAPHKTIDLAFATGPWGSLAFIEGMGVGLFTEVMAQLDARGNRDLAHLSRPEEILVSVQDVLIDRLSRYPSFRMKVFLDGRDLSGEFILLEAMNIQFVGPNLCLAPDANPSDGLLDLAFFYEGQRDNLIDQIVESGRGTLSPLSLPPVTLQGRLLEMELQGLPVHIDDEIWPAQDSQALSRPIEITASIKRDSLAFLGRV